MRMLLASALALGVAACGDILGTAALDVDVRTDRDAYRSGDELVLRMTNAGPDTVRHYGFPCASLEQLTSDGWQQLGSLPGQPCSPHLAGPGVPLAPGTTDSAHFPLDSTFQVGQEYRFMILVEGRNGPRDQIVARTNSFTVTPAD